MDGPAILTVLTPIGAHEQISWDVRSALGRQGLAGPWHVYRTPRPINAEHKLKNVVLARNELRLLCHTEFALWLDSDVLLPDNCLQPMIERLRTEPELGALGVYVRDDGSAPGHVGMGALLVRGKLCRQTVFKAEPPCECYHHAAKLRDSGWRVEYDLSTRAVEVMR